MRADREDALRDLDRLQADVAARGVDAVLRDLRANDGTGGPEERRWIDHLVRTLDREAHCLRRWDAARWPAFFLQQVRNRCFDMGIAGVQALAEERLARTGWRWLRERFPVGGDPEALVRTLDGHGSGVLGVVVLGGAHLAVSAGGDEVLKVWDLITGREVLTVEGAAFHLRCLAPTAPGGFVVSASSMSLQVWDVTTWQIVRTLEGEGDFINAVALTDDGSLAVAGAGSTVKVWDVRTGRLVHLLREHDIYTHVRCVAVTADGGLAVSAADDGTLVVWDLTRGQAIRILEQHTSGAVSLNDRFVVSASRDGTLEAWDITTGWVPRTLRGRTGKMRGGVLVTPDGRSAVAPCGNRIRVWDLATFQPVCTLEGHADAVTGLALTPNGRTAVSASFDRTLKVWDLRAGQSARVVAGHAGEVTGVALIRGDRFAVTASADRTLKLWDLATGQVIRTLEGHTEGVTGVAAAADGRLVVSASRDKTLKVWDLDAGRALRTLEGHAEWVRCVAVTEDGRLAASGSEDDTVRIWDVASGQPIWTFRHPREPPRPDKGLVINGQSIQTYSWKAYRMTGVALTANGRVAVSASDDAYLKVWDLSTGQVLHTILGGRYEQREGRVSTTPDGRFAVSVHWGQDADRLIKVWDLGSGQLVRDLPGHSGTVSITPDLRFAASAPGDRTLTLWDLSTGEPLAILETPAPLGCCALSADGRTLLAGDATGTLHILDLQPPAVQAEEPRLA